MFVYILICFKIFLKEKILFKKNQIILEEEEKIIFKKDFKNKIVGKIKLFKNNEKKYIILNFLNEKNELNSKLIILNEKNEIIKENNFEYIFIDLYFKNDFLYFINNNNLIFCYNKDLILIWTNLDLFLNYNVEYQILIEQYIYFLRLDQFLIIDLKTGKIIEKIFLNQKYKNFTLIEERIILYSDKGFLEIYFLDEIKIRYTNLINIFNKNIQIFEDSLYLNEEKLIDLREDFFIINNEFLIIYNNSKMNNNVIITFNLKNEIKKYFKFNNELIKSLKIENDNLIILTTENETRII